MMTNTKMINQLQENIMYGFNGKITQKDGNLFMVGGT